MEGTTSTRPERVTHSVEAAAAMLGISRALAYQLVRSGEIPSIKLGRRVVIPRTAFWRFLDAQPLTEGVDGQDG